MEQNEITMEQRDTVTILDIKGDITVFSEPFLNEAYSNASNLGASRILLKFDANAYINSGGIALLIQLLAQAKRANQVVAIAGLSSHFKKIFHMVGISKFARIFDSPEDAIMNLSA
jgi:anti-anti-sigma factor